MSAALAASVMIPTFRRPESLERAARSLFNQTALSSHAFELVIVDNDRDASARAVIERLAREAPPGLCVKGVYAPAPGVANARNAGLEHVETRLVACLDDDQTAQPGWLEALLATHARWPAAIVFGPVYTALPETVRAHRAYLETFFSRDHGPASGYIDDFYGCGNALIDLGRVLAERPLFAVETNETGGEDDRLFSRVQGEGGRFAWASEAGVYEHVPAERARLSYTLRRALAYGQGPCTLALKAQPRQLARLAAWIAIGAGQTLVYGAVAAGAFLLRRRDRAYWLDRAARGLGKVIWWKSFRFYGNAAPVATAGR